MDRKVAVKALDELFLSVGTYRRSREYRELLDFLRRFPALSPYNAMLIHVQKPGCRCLLTASKWWKLYQRKVRPGARPLVILRPFGPVAFVFDVSDTEGRAVPDQVLNPFPVYGSLSSERFDTLCNNLPKEGVMLHSADCGPEFAGSMTRDEGQRPQILGRRRVRQYFRLMVRCRLSREERFATMAHELGHMLCGHLGSPLRGWLPERRGMERTVREFEAESVAWLVCERLGIRSLSSSVYLSGYLEKNEDIPPISLETVLRAAGFIEDMTLSRDFRINGKLVVAGE